MIDSVYIFQNLLGSLSNLNDKNILILCDGFIAFSYLTIFFSFIYTLITKKQVRLTRTGVMFGLFLLACSVTYILMIWTIWNFSPGHRIFVKILTAIASVATSFVLLPLIPRILSIPTVSGLEYLNDQLAEKIKERDEALAQLRIETLERSRAQDTLIQSNKMEAVGQLTGGIAHDFNNLLMAISGSLELIQKNPHSDRVNRWIDTGIESVTRAAHLTAQLLTFSRVQKLQLKEVKLLPLLSNFMEMIERTIGPDIKISLVSTDDVMIVADPTQLELAILNLAINARDAMPQGGKIVISTNISKDVVEIDVSDTGTGIPEDIIGKIFDPFFTTKDVGKGTGLGLSMVYGIASQSDGNVYVKKTSSQGTTITFCMPLIVPTQEEVLIKETPEFSASNIDQIDILLIDDDLAVRETLSEILINMGHRVTTSEDGVEALVYLKSHKPSLILVDYAMPMMNGAAVMKAAKLIYDDVPIVFITGYSESAAIVDYTVLKKPVSIQDIGDLLKKIFR